MKKNHNAKSFIVAALVLSLFLFSSCTKSSVTYIDGTYTGRSSDYQDDEDGNGAGYGVVTLTLSGGKVESCNFLMYELDGTLKDDSYGSSLSKANRLKAQKAVQSASKYASQLIEKKKLSDVDVISGATISYNEFTEAVSKALSQATRK